MNQNQKFKVKQFQWFEMQTRVRQMVQQIITPIQKRILQHSTNMAKFKQTQTTDSLKVQQLTLMITGDPKIFQIGIFKEVDKRFQVHQKSFEQMRRLFQQSNKFVDQKFDLLDLRMKQTNALMMNFVSLKQRVNTEIQMQNENIQKVRSNLQKMISKLNQDISTTNERIVQNLMICQKTDYNLHQRIKANQMAIDVNKDFIQRNKQNITEKNIQIQTHQFKIDKIFQKLREVDKGQSINQKMQQYMKDMQISIRKCEFRVQAVTPLVTMAQLQQALQYILPEKLRKKIIIFGYKKYNKLNREILQKSYDEVREKFNGLQLIQGMQKKNMREVTSLKRKKIISMGIDIDHLTFQARERYYQQVDMDELSQQQQDNQNTAKIDQAQILNLVSLYFNEFTTDVSQKVKNQLQDTKAYLYGMQSQLKKQMQMNYIKAKKSQQQCLQFHRDQMLQMKSVVNQLQDVDDSRRQLQNWLARGQQVEKKFYNFCSLINHLQIQEEIDKQNISLMGLQEGNKGGLGLGLGDRENVNKERSYNVGSNNMNSMNNNGQSNMNSYTHQLQQQQLQKKNNNNILQLNDKCFSCCGYPASVLSSFKMACLAYHPSGIVIDGKQYRREDVLEFTTNLLQTIKASLQLNNNSSNNNISNGQSMGVIHSVINNDQDNYNNTFIINDDKNKHDGKYTRTPPKSRQKYSSINDNGLDTLERLGNNSRLQYLVNNSSNIHQDDEYFNTNINPKSQYQETTTINNKNDINSKLTIMKPQQPSINTFNQTLHVIQPELRLKSSSMRLRKSVKKNNPLSIDQRKQSQHHHRSRSTYNNTSLSQHHHYNQNTYNTNNQISSNNSNSNGNNNNQNNNSINGMSKQMLTVTNNFIQLKKKHLNYLT